MGTRLEHLALYSILLVMPPRHHSKILLQGVLFPCVYSKAILKLNKHCNLMSVQASEPIFSHHQPAGYSLSYKAPLRAENLSTLTPFLISCLFHSIPFKFLLRFFEKRAFFFPKPTILYMKQKSNSVNYSECSLSTVSCSIPAHPHCQGESAKPRHPDI